jgi:phosphoenolpyruvate-protein kinase (PTS system EI component)
LPESSEDKTKFLLEEDVIKLCDTFLDMLFRFKHRGAVNNAADCFEHICKKLMSNAHFRDIPKKFLGMALDRIATESHSAVLRRSAGIPPAIVAILRAEPDMLKAVH